MSIATYAASGRWDIRNVMLVLRHATAHVGQQAQCLKVIESYAATILRHGKARRAFPFAKQLAMLLRFSTVLAAPYPLDLGGALAIDRTHASGMDICRLGIE
jgi:hypothetical protein